MKAAATGTGDLSRDIEALCRRWAAIVEGTAARYGLHGFDRDDRSLLCLADAASRYLARPEITGNLLPVGVLTGLLGGPFFLLLLWQNRRRAMV